ncbi:MAG: flagellar assembly peptidoglycan hydrolase FlgJ [Gammaproteobacteria bacterium]|jgi:flagellar protein FlgJ|nr:flagellar assembly peptidoglycan hydrolase FlgJ [Gammaproteobacteria bacterium]
METSFTNTFNYFDLSALSGLKGKKEGENDETLKVVAQQLESVFLELVLKSMHDANSSMKSELFDRDQEDFYQSMLNQQMALSLSKAGGIGLADVIVKQLKPKDSTHVEIDQSRLSKTYDENHHMVSTSAEMVVLPPVIQNLFNTKIETEEKTQHSKRIESAVEFIETLLPFAQKAAEVIGIDPKLLLAQSALETGWGKHIIQHEDGNSSHNLFGVKALAKWDGERVLAKTLEYNNTEAHVENATFKAYPSYRESFEDFILLVKSKRYEKALENVNNPKSFLTELHQAGYATDPNYVEKVLSIYERFIR